MRKKPVSLRLDDKTIARGARVGAHLRAHSPSPTLAIHDTDVWVAILARGLDAWESEIGVADPPKEKPEPEHKTLFRRLHDMVGLNPNGGISPDLFADLESAVNAIEASAGDTDPESRAKAIAQLFGHPLMIDLAKKSDPEFNINPSDADSPTTFLSPEAQAVMRTLGRKMPGFGAIGEHIFKIRPKDGSDAAPSEPSTLFGPAALDPFIDRLLADLQKQMKFPDEVLDVARTAIRDTMIKQPGSDRATTQAVAAAQIMGGLWTQSLIAQATGKPDPLAAFKVTPSDETIDTATSEAPIPPNVRELLSTLDKAGVLPPGMEKLLQQLIGGRALQVTVDVRGPTLRIHDTEAPPGESTTPEPALSPVEATPEIPTA